MPDFPANDHFRALENPDYELVSGPSDSKRLQSRLKLLSREAALGVDTETTGLDPFDCQVRLIQVGSTHDAVLVDLDGWRAEGQREVPWHMPGLKELRAVLEGPVPKVLHNAAFDLVFLRAEGVKLRGPFFDTMIATKLINNGTGIKNDLGSVTGRVLKVELSKELQKAKWEGELTEEMLKYAARDAIVLPRLAEALAPILKGAEVKPGRTLMHLFRLEMKCLEPIALMHWYGFQFDAEQARQLKDQLEMEAQEKLVEFLDQLDEELRHRHPEDKEKWLPRNPDGSFNTRAKTSGSVKKGTKVYAGFNARSGTQVKPRFQDAGMVLPVNDKGEPSLDQNLLAFLRAEIPLADLYLRWKEQMTAVSQIESLLKHQKADGRIHGSYRQMGAQTGRLSAAEPNLQQIKRDLEFRQLFRARVGHKLVVADFSQIELRVAAELSGEERMRVAYRAGRDLHTETACLITGKEAKDITKTERTSAKIVNFGLLFGSGPATLRKQAMSQYGVNLSHKEAKELVMAFRVAYPRLKEWQDEEGNKTTKAVFTLSGRRRILIGFDDKFTTRINTQVQGTAGDVAKIAIGNLFEELRDTPEDEARLICMCHDEIVLEVADEAVEKWQPKLTQAMESAGNSVCAHVPIIAEGSFGDSWAEAK
jgi:DNA polymerase I